MALLVSHLLLLSWRCRIYVHCLCCRNWASDVTHCVTSQFSRAQMRALMGLGLAPREGEITCSRRKCLNQALASHPVRAQVDRHSPWGCDPGSFLFPSCSSSHKLTSCPWYREIKVWKAVVHSRFPKPTWLPCCNAEALPVLRGPLWGPTSLSQPVLLAMCTLFISVQPCSSLNLQIFPKALTVPKTNFLHLKLSSIT